MRTLALASALVLAAGQAWSDNLPDIGEPADQYLSPQKESLIGNAFLQQLEQQGAILDDPEIATYLQSLGLKLSSGSGQQPFRFFVVKSDQINAFAVPGGFIGIHAGLFLASRNEGELAGVVAHEIAHVTQRHIARYYADAANTNMASIGAILAGLALALSGSGTGAAAVMMAGSAANYQSMINHTRSHEKEADRVGIQYLARAGYDPADLASFFEVMQNRSLEADKRFEILRTHPLDGNRIAEAKSRAAQMPSPDKKPDDRLYQLAKARLTVLAGDDRELLQHLRRQPEDEMGVIDRYALAQILTQRGLYSEANKTIDQLQEKAPEELAFGLARVRLYNEQGQHEKALKELERWQSLYPRYRPVLDYQIETLRYLDRHQAIIELLEDDYLRGADNWPPRRLHLYAEALKHAGHQARSQLALAEHYIATARYRAAGLQIKEAKDSGQLSTRLSQRAEEMLKNIEEYQSL
ncbi:MAG: M48 family metalloprotease [Pseudomonadota bacterium]